jgi:lysine 2,3-aminomutase
LAELSEQPDEKTDPTGDLAFSPVEGIVHRYPDRALLKLLHVCPVYCRFCFRRAVVGPNSPAYLAPQALAAAMGYIADHSGIWEVILTGGDPLTLSREARTSRPSQSHRACESHSPAYACSGRRSQEDHGGAGCFAFSGKTVYVALHANHPREMSKRRAACAKFIDGYPNVEPERAPPE